MATPTYVPLATLTLSSASATVTFSSIPAAFRDLVLIFSGEPSGSFTQAGLRFNSNAGSNYTSVVMGGNANPPFSGSATFNQIPITQAFSFSAGDGNYSQSQIMDYSVTDKHKTVLTRSAVAAQTPIAHAGRFASTEAINTISVVAFISNQGFAIGSTFSLYGVN